MPCSPKALPLTGSRSWACRISFLCSVSVQCGFFYQRRILDRCASFSSEQHTFHVLRCFGPMSQAAASSRGKAAWPRPTCRGLDHVAQHPWPRIILGNISTKQQGFLELTHTLVGFPRGLEGIRNMGNSGPGTKKLWIWSTRWNDSAAKWSGWPPQLASITAIDSDSPHRN